MLLPAHISRSDFAPVVHKRQIVMMDYRSGGHKSRNTLTFTLSLHIYKSCCVRVKSRRNENGFVVGAANISGRTRNSESPPLMMGELARGKGPELIINALVCNFPSITPHNMYTRCIFQPSLALLAGHFTSAFIIKRHGAVCICARSLQNIMMHERLKLHH
jgi:hypothetical protein